MEHPIKENLTAPGVMEKYKTAGKVAEDVLIELSSKCVDGADVYELCVLGNQRIVEHCSKVYNQKKTDKGSAFPVCISVNDICAYFSPIKEESMKLAKGDLVKIDLGVHIDGYPALLAHSLIVGGEADDLKLRAINAAYEALETATKLFRVGNTNSQITAATNKVIEAYKCQPLEGGLSHEVKRYVIDGNNCIISKESFDHKVQTYNLQQEDVFAIEIFVTANELEGKAKESEFRTTVYKKNIDVNTDLKSKAGKQFLAEANHKFSDLAFSLNQFDDELMARAGLSECSKTNHLQPYPVLLEKSKAPVAHFKWTVGVSNKRVLVLSSCQQKNFYSFKREELADAELAKIVATPLDDFTNKKKGQ